MHDLRFILRAEPRSGSHMAMSLLHQHPELTCPMDEPFANGYHRKCGLDRKWPMHQQVVHLWTVYNGFIIQGHDSVKYSRLKRELPRHEPLVVWLHRRDEFKHAVSKYIADKLQQWSSVTTRELPKKKWRIPVGPLVKTIRTYRKHTKRDKKLYRELQQLHVDYEDLCSPDLPRIRAQMYAFLGLPDHDIVPHTVRAFGTHALSEYVEDVEELEVQFRERLNAKTETD